MKAITTTYRGPTNHRGPRIIARAEGGLRVVVPYDHGAHDPHRAAAETFARRLGWEGALVEGTLPNRDRVFVFVTTCELAEARAFARRRLAERVVRGEVA